ncbi:MAG TPA: SDR family NAD(P)-dependent oxidoreductase [Hyphomicrobiaceae bacterium]|mgnify:CR=1 FL=1|nr:SDR family NAD(P)-dependent oxidoreductase [Hyphomicrobiaceae bacterium]
MLLSSRDVRVEEFEAQAMLYPEVAGRRVLITGVRRGFGLDIARTFAEAGAQLIVQFDELTDDADVFSQMLAATAPAFSAHHGRFATADQIVAFGRSAAQELGGIDVVLNIVPLDGAPQAPGARLDAAAVESMISDRLMPACLVSRIAANRMRLMLTEGLILNLATLAPDADKASRAFAQVAKSALSQMTKREAQGWAEHGIRFNAVAPPVQAGSASAGGLGGEMDVAALALYLASGRGKTLSGHTFEAEPLPDFS